MSNMSMITAAARRLTQAAQHAALVPPLLTRITIGLGYFHTGLGKWHHFDRTAEFFASVGIPFARANAGFISWLEIVGGVLLLAGLLTRVAATLLAGSMTVALLTADRADFLASWGSSAETTPTDVASFVFLLFLMWLIVHGAGPLGLDALLARRSWRAARERRAPPSATSGMGAA
jgi:putative oxidoreductase